MLKLKRLHVNLALFDGAESGDGAATGDTNGEPGNTHQAKTGDNILYGKHPEVQNQDNTSVAGKKDNPVDVDKEFSDLINGKYKDAFTKKSQEIVNKIFKETKELEASVAKNQNILDMLSERYKIADKDPDKIIKALEDDDNYLQEQADEAGMTKEQLKQFRKLEKQNAAYEQEKKQRDIAANIQNQVAKWAKEGEELKAKYPNFDFKEEVKNQSFLSMLKANVPVETAYIAIHHGEIVESAKKSAAAEQEGKIIASVRAKGLRPQENGTASQGATIVKDDVSKLTKEDRARIAQLAMKGEIISF